MDIDGPYMGANSDSDITKSIVNDARNGARNITSWLRPQDIMIVDRGFYDTVDVLRDMGFDVSN